MVKDLRSDETSTINILHVSDLHANAENSADRARFLEHVDAFLHDPVLSNTRIDILAFTGDAAYRGTEAEFDIARKRFFEPLCKQTGIGPDRILIVPGNHDVKQPKPDTPEGRRQADLHEKLKGASRDEVDNLFLEQEGCDPRLKDFYEFRKKLTHDHQATDPVYRKISLNDYQIMLCGFNSAWRCTDSRVDRTNLFISEEQILRALPNLLNDSSDLRIALVHHDLASLHGNERYTVIERIRQYFEISFFTETFTSPRQVNSGLYRQPNGSRCRHVRFIT